MIAIRPLVVDDSVVVRRTLSEVFRAVPCIEECAVAANGKIAIDRIAQDCPDIVILDMEMPGMNGLDVLRVLRNRHPNLPVIMFSSLTESGAKETIEALAIGATDYVAKPAGQTGLTETMNRIRNELVPKILAICQPDSQTPTMSNPSSTLKYSDHDSQQPRVLAIGGSTGGPRALETVFECLPADFPLPIVVAQHMPPIFTARLADHLNSKCKISVAEANRPCKLRPGHAWIAAGDGNLVVKRDHTAIWCEPVAVGSVNSIHPSVDVLFESVAQVFGGSTLALVLNGMGSDGKRGCEFIRAAQGSVLVQDKASSVVWGMPGAVADAGLAREIVPLNQIGPRLLQLTSDVEKRCRSYSPLN